MESTLQRALRGTSAKGEDTLKRELQEACTAVIERTATELKQRGNLPTASILDVALNHLTLGRAGLYKAIISQSEISNWVSLIAEHVAAAVDGLRAAGDVEYIGRGLLTQAWLRQVSGDARGSREDLDEAWEIAQRGPMPLFQADILLSRVRLFGMRDARCEIRDHGYPWGSAREDLAVARRLIDTHGYHRRDEEFADAEQAARTWSRSLT